jgi:hypothetical protein
LDLQDRERILEPSEAKSGQFLTGKIQFLIQEKTAIFTPKLEVFKKFREIEGSLNGFSMVLNFAQNH